MLLTLAITGEKEATYCTQTPNGTPSYHCEIVELTEKYIWTGSRVGYLAEVDASTVEVICIALE
jgi:hypothetical protein